MNEFDDTIFRENILDDNNDLESFNEELNIEDNIDNDNISMSQSQKTGSFDGISPFDENMISIGNNNNNNNNNPLHNIIQMSYLEGFSYLKSDEIKEYIHQFGDGNKNLFKALPNYSGFSKVFTKLQNWKSTSNLGNMMKKDKKTKKEVKLFEFSEENEIEKHDVFDKESKIKSRTLKDRREPKIKKKVKQFYSYDRSM